MKRKLAMYKRRRERRRRIINHILHWYPIATLLVMFVLGACTRGTSTQASLLQTETKKVTEQARENIKEHIIEENKALEKEQFEETKDLGDLPDKAKADVSITENGNYTSKDEVALYIHNYKHLPSNYMSKKEAEDAGWDSKNGNLSDVLPGISIGGSRFGNYDKKLPQKSGRKYYECDIDYTDGYRNAKRIIYSNDGLIFYTDDHYESFEQLY